MKKLIDCCLILAVFAAAAALWQTDRTLTELEHSVIRLHILADSDSTDDQMEKLLVRDALLAQAQTWIPENADFETGCAALRDNLSIIQQTAEQALRQSGSNASVRVSLEESDFPARSYGEVTLPAGCYEALRVEIGEAMGQNWWCVMYPALCIPAAADDASKQIPDEAARDMALHPEQYEVRLKCVDAARAVIGWLRGTIEEAVPPQSGETASCADR